ncbi:MAG TPA: hypothetical protein VL285_14320 [Bryobacteraceae bacterium]|nr:hypothetical protein [Bryobacteraceae bacterium]
MGKRAEQIEKEIEQERTELDRNLKELEHRVRDATNWRLQFQKHPGPLLGGAFAVGVGLAMLSSRNGRSPRRQLAAPSAAPPPRSESGETWQIVRTAIIALAAQRLSALVDQYVPGFQQHYREAASKVRGPAHAV